MISLLSVLREILTLTLETWLKERFLYLKEQYPIVESNLPLKRIPEPEKQGYEQLSAQNKSEKGGMWAFPDFQKMLFMMKRRPAACERCTKWHERNRGV